MFMGIASPFTLYREAKERKGMHEFTYQRREKREKIYIGLKMPGMRREI